MLRYLIFVPVLIWYAIRMYQLFAPFWLLPRGKAAEARALQASLERSWLFRELGRYGRATTDLWMGNDEEGLQGLRLLNHEKARKGMKLGIDMGIGSTLVWLERELPEARMRLERALAVSRTPDLLLFLAHCHLGLGEAQQAEERYEEAMGMIAAGAPSAWLAGGTWRPTTWVEQSNKLLAGWYLARIGRRDEALPLLEAAARWEKRTPMNDEAEKKLASLGLLSPKEPRAPNEEERTSAPPVMMDRAQPRCTRGQRHRGAQ